jgi:hypothetical protein
VVPLPDGKATEVQAELLTPERAEGTPLATTINDGRVSFTVPSVLVYGVVEVRWK